jgi:hypothetical protein
MHPGVRWGRLAQLSTTAQGVGEQLAGLSGVGPVDTVIATIDPLGTFACAAGPWLTTSPAGRLEWAAVIEPMRRPAPCKTIPA